MKYLMLFALISCASKDPKVRTELHSHRLAGMWAQQGVYNEKTSSFVTITCRGQIHFDFKDDHYWWVWQTSGQGTILGVKGDELLYRNWTTSRKKVKWSVTPPTTPNGCWRLLFDDHVFYTTMPLDCTQEDDVLLDAMWKAANNKTRTCDELRAL